MLQPTTPPPITTALAVLEESNLAADCTALLDEGLIGRTLVEPARHFANEMARTGQTVWLYRSAYVSQAQRGQNMGGAARP